MQEVQGSNTGRAQHEAQDTVGHGGVFLDSLSERLVWLEGAVVNRRLLGFQSVLGGGGTEFTPGLVTFAHAFGWALAYFL